MKQRYHFESSSRLLFWCSKITQPSYQLFLLIFTTTVIAFFSYSALYKQTPLEEIPLIYPISEINTQQSSDPATVEVGFQITHMPTFNSFDDKFAFEGKLWFLFDPAEISLDTVKKFSFEKAKIVYQSEPELKLINGKLFAEINLRIKCNSGLVNTAFPLDAHRIFINLTNQAVTPQEMVFKCDETQFLVSPAIHIPEWKASKTSVITGYTRANLDTDDTNKKTTHPKVIFAIDFSRSGLRHVFIILLPLFLICVMAMIALGVQEQIIDKALDISLAGAASIIAYRFVIESMSPRSSSFMIADYIFTFFLIISCLQVLFAKMTYLKKELPPFFLFLRAILALVLYLFFIIIWGFLLFIWIPSKAPVAPLSEKITEKKSEIQITTQSSLRNASLQVGTTFDSSRTDASFTKHIKHGIELRLQAQRDTDEATISVLFMDDESFPLKARNNVRALRKKGISILLSPVGTSTLASYLDLIEDEKVCVIFPFTGATLFRQPELTNIIHLRPSWYQEGTLLMKYALETIKAGRIIVFYEETPFGNDALSGIQKIAEEEDIPNGSLITIPYQKNNHKFESQVAQIKNSNADTFIFCASAAATEELIRQLGIEQLLGKTLLGTSHLNNTFFKQFTLNKGILVITCSVVPNPATSTLPIVESFRTEATKKDIPLDTYALEAYINTDLFLHIIHHINDEEITPESIREVVESFRNYSYKGLTLNFNKKTGCLGSSLWIDTGDSEWKQFLIGKGK